MEKLKKITNYLDELLPAEEFTDRSLNGLQVDSGNADITKIAFAVDAGLSVFEEAIREEADLLVVHHGMLWGQEFRISGTMGTKIRKLIQNGCSLYASHLPMDGNMEVGNNVEIARALNLKDIEADFLYKGNTIGVKGEFPEPVDMAYIEKKALELTGQKGINMPFGTKKITSVGIVSGGASSVLPEASEKGFDLFLSGEPRHSDYHVASELKINAAFWGHYLTETFGPKAIQARLEKNFEISTVWIDKPTGL